MGEGTEEDGVGRPSKNQGGVGHHWDNARFVDDTHRLGEPTNGVGEASQTGPTAIWGSVPESSVNRGLCKFPWSSGVNCEGSPRPVRDPFTNLGFQRDEARKGDCGCGGLDHRVRARQPVNTLSGRDPDRERAGKI